MWSTTSWQDTRNELKLVTHTCDLQSRNDADYCLWSTSSQQDARDELKLATYTCDLQSRSDADYCQLPCL